MLLIWHHVSYNTGDPTSAKAEEEKVVISPAVTSIKRMGYSEDKIEAAINIIKSRLPRGKTAFINKKKLIKKMSMNNLIYFNSWSAIHKLIVYPLSYNIMQLNNRYKKNNKTFISFDIVCKDWWLHIKINQSCVIE